MFVTIILTFNHLIQFSIEIFNFYRNEKILHSLSIDKKLEYCYNAYKYSFTLSGDRLHLMTDTIYIEQN